MALNVKPVKPAKNADVLNAIRNVATDEYRKRVPKATQANVESTMQNLLNNVPLRNEFLNALVNRVGKLIGRNYSWTNPLAKFKMGMLEHGDTIEEVMVGLLEAKSYDVNKDYLEADLFGQERPLVQSSFHKINREDWYKVTINRTILQRAFLPGDDYSLDSLARQIIASASKSDNWDEFLLMTRLFTEYEKNDGFYKVNVPDAAADGSTSAETNPLLRSIRAWSGNLQFISDKYNAAGMPMAATADELELFITPELDAALDVESLAGAFNIDRAEVYTRKTLIPKEKMPDPRVQAILTTRDFFVVADTYYETAEIPNPIGLYSNFILHHHQVISASRFVPAVMFWTGPGDETEQIETPVTGISAVTVYGEDETGEMVPVDTVERGETYLVDASATTTPADGVNTAVRYGLVGAESFDTYITQNGALYVGQMETADSITVLATSLDNPTFSSENPSGVVGARLQLWPNPSVIEDDEETDPGE